MRRLTLLGLGCFAGTALLACAVGRGDGHIAGTVHIPLCGMPAPGMPDPAPYDLHPSFYAASREGNVLTIRIQNGGAPADYADHLVFEVDDTEAVTQQIDASGERDEQGNHIATLSVGPSGSPEVLVHAIFEPTLSCGRTKVTRLGQDVGLWAYSGTITFRSVDRGPNPPGVTTATYHRLTDVVRFDIALHDPRPVGVLPATNVAPPAGVSPTDPIGDAHLAGWFRFQFDTSAPAQPFGPGSP
jgi:hypothetical protein